MKMLYALVITAICIVVAYGVSPAIAGLTPTDWTYDYPYPPFPFEIVEEGSIDATQMKKGTSVLLMDATAYGSDQDKTYDGVIDIKKLGIWITIYCQNDDPELYVIAGNGTIDDKNAEFTKIISLPSEEDYLTSKGLPKCAYTNKISTDNLNHEVTHVYLINESSALPVSMFGITQYQIAVEFD